MKPIRQLLKILGCGLCVLWALNQGHTYSLLWGFWGWFAGTLFFIPLTLYSMFILLIHGMWTDLLLVIVYIAVAFLLIMQAGNE